MIVTAMLALLANLVDEAPLMAAASNDPVVGTEKIWLRVTCYAFILVPLALELSIVGLEVAKESISAWASARKQAISQSMSGAIQKLANSFEKPPISKTTVIIFFLHVTTDFFLAFVLIDSLYAFPVVSYFWVPLNFFCWYKILEAFDQKLYATTHHLFFVAVTFTSPVAGPYNRSTILTMFVVSSAITVTVEAWLVTRRGRRFDGFPPVHGQVQETLYFNLPEVMAACPSGTRALIFLLLVCIEMGLGCFLHFAAETAGRGEIPGMWVAACYIWITFTTENMIVIFPDLEKHVKPKYVRAGRCGVVLCCVPGLLEELKTRQPVAGDINDWLTSHPIIVVMITTSTLIIYMIDQVLVKPQTSVAETRNRNYPVVQVQANSSSGAKEIGQSPLSTEIARPSSTNSLNSDQVHEKTPLLAEGDAALGNSSVPYRSAK